jgi:hypothetical protein
MRLISWTNYYATTTKYVVSNRAGSTKTYANNLHRNVLQQRKPWHTPTSPQSGKQNKPSCRTRPMHTNKHLSDDLSGKQNTTWDGTPRSSFNADRVRGFARLGGKVDVYGTSLWLIETMTMRSRRLPRLMDLKSACRQSHGTEG